MNSRDASLLKIEHFRVCDLKEFLVTVSAADFRSNSLKARLLALAHQYTMQQFSSSTGEIIDKIFRQRYASSPTVLDRHFQAIRSTLESQAAGLQPTSSVLVSSPNFTDISRSIGESFASGQLGMRAVQPISVVRHSIIPRSPQNFQQPMITLSCPAVNNAGLPPFVSPKIQPSSKSSVSIPQTFKPVAASTPMQRQMNTLGTPDHHVGLTADLSNLPNLSQTPSAISDELMDTTISISDDGDNEGALMGRNDAQRLGATPRRQLHCMQAPILERQRSFSGRIEINHAAGASDEPIPCMTNLAQSHRPVDCRSQNDPTTASVVPQISAVASSRRRSKSVRDERTNDARLRSALAPINEPLMVSTFAPPRSRMDDWWAKLMRPGFGLFGKQQTLKPIDKQQANDQAALVAGTQAKSKRRPLSPCGKDPPFRMPDARPACIPVGFPFFVDGVDESVIQVGGPRFLETSAYNCNSNFTIFVPAVIMEKLFDETLRLHFSITAISRLQFPKQRKNLPAPTVLLINQRSCASLLPENIPYVSTNGVVNELPNYRLDITDLALQEYAPSSLIFRFGGVAKYLQIQLAQRDICGYAVGVLAVRPRTIQQFMEKIPVLSRGMTKTRIKKMFDEQDLEIATDYIGISLICPIRCPIRGINCKHVACFDAEAFLSANMKAQRYFCPLCNDYIPPHKLVIDSLLRDILQEAKAKEVIFYRDGFYEICDGKTASDQQNMKKGSKKQERDFKVPNVKSSINFNASVIDLT